MTEPTDLIVAMRRVIRAARVADLAQLPDIDLAADTASLHAIAERLEAEAVDDIRMQITLRTDGLQERLANPPPDRTSRAMEIGLKNFFPYSPYIGPLNPIAPPLEFRVVPGEPWAEIEVEHTFSALYNGPPGAVHGGVISGAMDELLGSVCVINDVSGFTGTLTIKYRALTPVEQPIRMRGWVERVEGRKTFAAATFHRGDTLCVEAEGIFVGGSAADVLS